MFGYIVLGRSKSAGNQYKLNPCRCLCEGGQNMIAVIRNAGDLMNLYPNHIELSGHPG